MKSNKKSSIYDDPLTFKIVLYTIENILKMIFPIVYLLAGNFYTDILAYLVNTLVIIRQLKPRLKSEFFAQLIYNEYFQNIIYTIPYCFFSAKGSLYYSVFAIHFIIGIAEFFYLVQRTPYLLMKNNVDQIRKNKKRMMQFKNFIEILILLYEMILVPFDFRKLIIVVFYCNYLRIKYYFNDNLQSVISEIDTYFKENFETPQSPKIFKYFVGFVRSIVLRLRVYKEK